VAARSRIHARRRGEHRPVKTWRLRSSLWVPHSPAAVFPFFADARNLERLTPPWLSFRVLTPQPIELQAGTLIDYRIALHGIPMRWRTRIARWEPPFAFADEQLRGPYTLWHHTHTFTPCDGGTVLGDEVVMRPKGGPLAGALMAMFVRGDVERIFRYRTKVMAKLFRGEIGRSDVQWLDRPLTNASDTG
jgi:ligand-binding SRPBCC domain-containing protein